MSKFFSIFFAIGTLLFTAACGTTSSNPDYRPQPNTYYPVELKVATPGESAFADTVDSFGRQQTMTPAQETMRVEWLLIPPCSKRNRNYAERMDAEITIKPEGSLNGITYYVDEIKRVGNDFFAIFYEDGVKMEIPFSNIPGGFVEGGFYEKPFAGTYGNCKVNGRRGALRIVWSTHEPIRGYQWAQRLFVRD